MLRSVSRDLDSDGEILAALRRQSRRIVHRVFLTLALGVLSLALGAHHAPEAMHLPPAEAAGIAMGFLYMGAAYVLTAYIWDWLMPVR